jgi:hypothetical protein
MSGCRTLFVSPWVPSSRRMIAAREPERAGRYGWEFHKVWAADVIGTYRNLRRAGCKPSAARAAVIALLNASNTEYTFQRPNQPDRPQVVGEYPRPQETAS